MGGGNNFRLNGQRCYLLIKEERIGRRHCEPYGIGQSIIQWALYMLLQIFQNMLTAEMVHGKFLPRKVSEISSGPTWPVIYLPSCRAQMEGAIAEAKKC